MRFLPPFLVAFLDFFAAFFFLAICPTSSPLEFGKIHNQVCILSRRALSARHY